jgi:hypothetical protein
LVLATTAIVTMVRGPDLVVYALAVVLAIVSAPFRAFQGVCQRSPKLRMNSRVAAGVDIMREGDRGDQFYLIEAGELEAVHGAAVVNRLKAGDHFG